MTPPDRRAAEALAKAVRNLRAMLIGECGGSAWECREGYDVDAALSLVAAALAPPPAAEGGQGGRRFPIQSVHGKPANHPTSVPWTWLARYAAGFQRNHSQSMERLSERGGLSPAEVWMIVHGKEWNFATESKNVTSEVANAWLASEPWAGPAEGAERELLERLAPKDISPELADHQKISIQWPDVWITAGDYRAARAALRRAPGAGEETG